MDYTVEDLKLKKNRTYDVKINGKTFNFDEDTVVKYRLVKGKNLSFDDYNAALKSIDISLYYNKAIDYTIKYGKGEAEVRRYLKDKGVNPADADTIIIRLKDAKILNDASIIQSHILGYIRNKNGRLLIRVKLLEKGFNKEMIEEALDNIDENEYLDSLRGLYKKIEHKYDKYRDSERIHRIKTYLYSHGYTLDEISKLDIN